MLFIGKALDGLSGVGLSALHVAVRGKHASIGNNNNFGFFKNKFLVVNQLLRATADVNVKSYPAESAPLHLAATLGFEECDWAIFFPFRSAFV